MFAYELVGNDLSPSAGTFQSRPGGLYRGLHKPAPSLPGGLAVFTIFYIYVLFAKCQNIWLKAQAHA